MRHRSVSRASESLHIGQSAMSYNLSRLRKLLNDPLFERQGHAMVPTRRAEELAPKATTVLEIITDDILVPDHFDPKISTEKISIGLIDYAEQVFGPVLFDRLNQEAPLCPVVFSAIDSGNCERAFEDGTVYLAIGVFVELNDSLRRTTLYRERHVCMFDNEILKVELPISLDDYLATPQAIVTASGELQTAVDATLKSMGETRRIMLGSSRFLTLRHLLTGRRLLSVMAEMMGKTELFGDNLTLCEPPITIPDFDIDMVIRKRDSNHPRMQWLVYQVETIVRHHVITLQNNSVLQ